MIRPDRLAQLRAERDAEAARVAADAAAEVAAVAAARELGRHMAAEVLLWHRVAALVAERATVNQPAHCLRWPMRREYLLPEVEFRQGAEWLAFLDGVAEVGALV